MDGPVICSPNCYICGEILNNNAKSVLETTQFSDKQLFKFIETFVSVEFDENIFSPSTPVEICESCVEKIEEYDNICMRAANIQEDILNLFNENLKRQEEEEEIEAISEEITCEKCLAQFLSADEMKDHECFVEDEELLIEFDDEDSAEDQKEFIDQDEKNEKQSRTRSDPVTYFCNVCQLLFDKKKDYQIHIKLAHLPEDATVFSCSECECEPFVTESELQLHFVLRHPKNPESSIFECPICSKAFSSKPLLNRHFGIHTADSNKCHYCQICGKSFFHYSSFQAHTKAHTDIRDFNCSECPKAFRSQSHLSRHMKTHTKTKNHKCTECDAAFAERYNLTVHLNAHFGIFRKKRRAKQEIE